MTTTRQAKICIETLLLRRRICGPPGLLAPQEGPSPFEVDDGQSAISRARVLFSLSVRWLINFHPGSGGGGGGDASSSDVGYGTRFIRCLALLAILIFRYFSRSFGLCVRMEF